MPTGPTTLGIGSKGKIPIFVEHGHVAYKIKWSHECSNMVANILPADPQGLNSTFSEHYHVAYQIKWNLNMLANMLPTDHPPPPPPPPTGPWPRGYKT